jgi:hypothetical protein
MAPVEPDQYTRVDEISSHEWKPLTSDELKSLSAIKLCKGKALVERELIARLLGERYRMMAAVRCSAWLVEEIQNEKLLPCNDYLEPLTIEKAYKAAENALQGCGWMVEDFSLD